MNTDRAKRLTRIATALGHVSDSDLLLVAEVAEDLALKSARIDVPAYPVDPLERGRAEREIHPPRSEPDPTASVLAQVTGGAQP